MALVLNDEEVMLKDSARSFLVSEAPTSLLRQLRDDNDELGYSEAIWAEFSSLGWP